MRHIKKCILICVRTTLNLDETLFEEAQQLTGIKEKTALIHQGLKSLIQHESARRLVMMGGTDRKASAGRRRRIINKRRS